MTDQAVSPAGQAAPATPPQTHAAAPAAVPASDAAKPADPNWLNGRIAQARQARRPELLSRLARAPSTKRRRPSRLLELRPKRRRPPSSGPSRLDGQLKNAAQQRDKARRRHQGARGARAQTLTPEQLAAVTGIAGRTRRAAARDRHAEADLGLERVRNDCAARGCRSNAQHNFHLRSNGPLRTTKNAPRDNQVVILNK